MAKTTKASASQAARRRAREAMQRDRERMEQRENKLAAAFVALDERESAERSVASAIVELKKLGGTHASIAEELGLSVREIGQLVALLDDEDESSDDDDVPSTDSNNRGAEDAVDADREETEGSGVEAEPAEAASGF
jgi:hypothetical protein